MIEMSEELKNLRQRLVDDIFWFQTLGSLRNEEGMGDPYFFGLGFIKLNLGPKFGGARLHFYHPELIGGGIVRDDDIHNHRYDFTSHILVGELHQFEYYWQPDSFYPVPRHPGKTGSFIVKCKEGEPLPTRYFELGTEHLIGSQIFAADSAYSLPATSFHRVEAHEPTVTLFVPGLFVNDTAIVLRPADNPPDVCPYSSPRTPEECWQLIDDMLVGL